jgi:hypothetical protein
MLSPMAKGIQTLHSTVELFNKYVPNPSNNDAVTSDTYDILFDWSLNHKTCISLNAGTSPDLEQLADFFEDSRNLYPWASFNEDESLGNLMTAISIVLPEKIYEAASKTKNSRKAFFNQEGYLVYEDNIGGTIFLEILTQYGKYTDYEQILTIALNDFRLAS